MTTVRTAGPTPSGGPRDFDGEVLEPGNASYEAARSATLRPGVPRLILRPRHAHDVQRAVRYAAASDAELAVRGGGHSFAGLSSGRGIVIDLAELRQVEILDESGGIVRVGGGATWGDVVDVLQPRGLAISAGDTKSVGVGGLTLSGGIGWKVRRYGLALDSLLAVEVVTADGRLVRADSAQLPDLFWAVRGGGGNVGVVTAFEFRAHRTTRVYFGRIAFAPTGRREILHGWAAHLRDAPDALTSIANLANPVAGGPEAPVEVFVAFDGDDPGEAGRAIDPLRRLGAIISDEVAVMPYDEILEPGGTPPPGIGFLTRSGFVDAGSSAVMLDLLSETAGSAGSPFISLRALGGAVARVPKTATAFAHRSADFLVTTVSAGPAAVVEAARPARDALWARLAPHVSGAYANFLDSATADDVRASYPRDTYERLVAIKGRFDPRNLFRLNHNVAPEPS